MIYGFCVDNERMLGKPGAQETDTLIQKLLNFCKENFSGTWRITPPHSVLQKDYLCLVQEIGELRGRDLLYPYLGSGRGKGVYVELLDGSVKMDLLGGVGVQILGHSHPEIQKAVLKAGFSDVLMQGHLSLNQEYLQLSRKLVDLVQKHSRLKHVWLTTSGSMAGENALKMVRQKNSPRRKILTFDRAFAGRTTLMSEITGNPKVKEGLPAYDEVLRIPFYDPQDPKRSFEVLKSHLKKEGDNICVFVFEIVLGEGGYRSAPAEFFISLFEECRKHGIALWADEVQTFLRTGQFFAFEKWGLGSYIDICTVGKGLQLAATFFIEQYKPRPGLVSGTFSSTTPALIAGLKVLEILDEGYMGEKGLIAETQKLFIELFTELKEKSFIKDYDVFGLMAAFSLLDSSEKSTKNFLKTLFHNGVIALSCGRNPYRVRFLIPAVIRPVEIKELKTALLKTFSDMQRL